MKSIQYNNIREGIKLFAKMMKKHLPPEDWMSYNQIITYIMQAVDEPKEIFISDLKSLINAHEIPQEIGERCYQLLINL